MLNSCSSTWGLCCCTSTTLLFFLMCSMWVPFVHLLSISSRCVSAWTWSASVSSIRASWRWSVTTVCARGKSKPSCPGQYHSSRETVFAAADVYPLRHCDLTYRLLKGRFEVSLCFAVCQLCVLGDPSGWWQYCNLLHIFWINNRR